MSRSVRGATAAMVCIGILTTSVGCAPGWDRNEISLSELLPNAELSGVTNPEDVTEQLCDDESTCVEAWTTEEATYYRFDSDADAEQLSEVIEGGIHVDQIAVIFHADITHEVRNEIIQLVNDAHAEA